MFKTRPVVSEGESIMYKKILIILGVCALMITLTACSNNENDNYEYYEYLTPSPEELRINFERFFEENRESIIETIATEGEDVRLELANGYEFLMFILLDDIELNDENRALYTITFGLTFSEMNDLFGRLAFEIKESAQIDNFRLTVIFIDINEEEISRSSFNANSLDEILEINNEIDEEY